MENEGEGASTPNRAGAKCLMAGATKSTRFGLLVQRLRSTALVTLSCTFPSYSQVVVVLVVSSGVLMRHGRHVRGHQVE